MTDLDEHHHLRNEPLEPEAVDGIVVLANPPADPLEFTADAAEISALRLMDAADAARTKF